MIKRVNPFKAIYSINNYKKALGKMKSLPEFPRYIDIELTNQCNFRCLMCFGTAYKIKRQKGYMENAVFNKILKEVKFYKTPVRFIRCGEPLLHPSALDYIREAKKAGCIVHLTTNGSLLNEKIIDELLRIPLDSIKFSFQGIDRETYKEMRNIDFYDELMEIIKLFHKKRREKHFPYMHASTTITYEGAEQVQRFKEAVKPFVDLVTVGRTLLEHIDINYVQLRAEEKNILKILKTKETVIKKHPNCPEVFDKLSINWDGTVTACCWDYDNLMMVGDINREPLKEIWTSNKINFYRIILVNMKYDDLPLCRVCYDYMDLEKTMGGNRKGALR